MKTWHVLHINWYRVPSINSMISFLNLDHHVCFWKRPRSSNQSDFFRRVKFLIRTKMVQILWFATVWSLEKNKKIFHKWWLNMWFTILESEKQKIKKNTRIWVVDICRSLFFPSCFFVVSLPSTKKSCETLWNSTNTKQKSCGLWARGVHLDFGVQKVTIFVPTVSQKA